MNSRPHSQSQPPSSASASLGYYVSLGLFGHLMWGSYPVFVKRAVAEAPKFSLLLLASLTVAAVGAFLVRQYDGLSWPQAYAILRQERALWGLAVFVVLRSVTNVISIDLTHAVWVQLINILTPFPVALLGAWFFGELAPRYTYRALTLSTVGGALMLVQDWSQVLSAFTSRDVLGLAMAAVSTLTLAMYFQLVRRSRLRQASGGLIMFQQGISMGLTHAVLSLGSGEDWSAWTAVSPMGWLSILGAILLAQVLGNLVQIVALGGTNAAIITSLMPLRLFSALTLGWLLLREQLVTPAQWIGMIVAVMTITVYLWLQRGD
ncbi:MAG: DMT family transporter [Anaerolineae bacterium]